MRVAEPVTAEDRDLIRPDWRLEPPLLFTWANAPARPGGHERGALPRGPGGWAPRSCPPGRAGALAQKLALGTNPGLLRSDDPRPGPVRRRVRRCQPYT